MKYVVSIILVLFSVFAILWMRSNIIALEYRLSNLEEKKKILLRENRNLLAQKASLTSFAKISRTDDCFLVLPDRKKSSIYRWKT